LDRKVRQRLLGTPVSRLSDQTEPADISDRTNTSPKAFLCINSWGLICNSIGLSAALASMLYHCFPESCCAVRCFQPHMFHNLSTFPLPRSHFSNLIYSLLILRLFQVAGGGKTVGDMTPSDVSHCQRVFIPKSAYWHGILPSLLGEEGSESP